MPKAKKKAPRRDAGRPRGEPIKALVLDHTLAELAEHGVESLSVERIARAADVNKTSIYRRWPTRDALVAAALERVLVDLEARLVDTGSVRGDLVALTQRVAAFVERPAGRALTRATISRSGAEEPPPPPLFGTVGAADRPAAALVERARARGEWRSDAQPEVVFGALVGAILHRVFFERRPTSRAWTSALVDLLVRGIAPTPQLPGSLRRG